MSFFFKQKTAYELRISDWSSDVCSSDLMLGTLDADGWLLGVATGKSDRGLRHILAAHGLTARFVTLQTADRHPSKPHPSMIEAAIAEAGAAHEPSVLIGDTSYDMAMARAAGPRAGGVAGGSSPRATLPAR